MFDIASNLSQMKPEDPVAIAQLMPLVYDELRKLAAMYMAGEKPGHTLDATALVHEVFLKLGGERSFASKSDLMQAAAQAMRRILVDHARARNAAKRGAGRRVEFDPEQLMVPPPNEDLESLDDALFRLNTENPALAKLVELRRFGGLPLDQCAEILGISPRTADTWWAYARAWLAVAIEKS